MTFFLSVLQVFKAAMVWIQSDVSSRRRHVFDVLKHVRLSLVPSKRLESYMKVCDITSVQQSVVHWRDAISGPEFDPRHVAKGCPQLFQDGHGDAEGVFGDPASSAQEVCAQADLRDRWLPARALLGLGSVRVHLWLSGNVWRFQQIMGKDSGPFHSPFQNTAKYFQL